LDCDPGIDDSLARLLALASEELDLKAITTVFGNVPLRQTTRNALSILELCELSDPPVVGAGSGQPLRASVLSARDANIALAADMARFVHGTDGLGNANLPEPGLKAATDDAIGLMISKIISGEADTVIATGPLTNLARAISRDTDITKKIKDIYVMGGAVFVEGNVTPYAEFNFYSDPDAADYVLNSEAAVTLISLDVTRKINVTDEHLKLFKGLKTRLAEFITGIIGYSIDFHRKYRGAAGAHLHDPLAVAIAAAPRLGQYEQLSLSVGRGDKRGMVKIKEGVKNIRFVKEVDADGFLKLFLNRIGGRIEII
jgi:purine nucleosidase